MKINNRKRPSLSLFIFSTYLFICLFIYLRIVGTFRLICSREKQTRVRSGTYLPCAEFVAVFSVARKNNREKRRFSR